MRCHAIPIMPLTFEWNQDTRAEGRGRVARIQRRLLIVEVERKIMQSERCKHQGQVRISVLFDRRYIIKLLYLQFSVFSVPSVVNCDLS